MSGTRRPTATSNFGVGRRENHDASEFYARFTPPVLSDDDDVRRPSVVDEVFCADARDMAKVDDASVALVVTSPPYFAGKAYEEALGEGGVPATYLDYLEMLHGVFAECVRVLEPGGRIAVNVANLGRKPYRSLAADVIGVLQDRLGLLLRGEVIWQKARGAGGSCAWGSFQSPANPVLRDLTERVVVASKGRFDRAQARGRRRRTDLPADATITRDEFMEATTDVWEFPAESATRVGHPAPFPVELPQRLIELYTYAGDLVLDPFLGSGTTAVAAIRTGRHYIGYDTDASYVERARERIAAEHATAPAAQHTSGRLADALAKGERATEVAALLLREAGFADVKAGTRATHGADVDLVAVDAAGRRWYFLVCGGFTTGRAGLRRAEVLWRALGRAAVVSAAGPVVLLSTDVPARGTSGDAALRSAVGRVVRDALELTGPATPAALAAMACGEG